MRRTVQTAALVLVLILCLTACGCGHRWNEATCEAPKTCRSCAATEGTALPHTPGPWVTANTNYVTAERLMVQQCEKCDEILDQDAVALDCLHNGTEFLLSAEDFAKRLTVQMQLLQEGYGEYTAEIAENDGKAQLNIYCTNGRIRETVGEVTFGIGGDELDYSRKDAENSYVAAGGIVGTDHLSVLMPALVQTVDPTMDVSEAFSHSESWISQRSIDRNGIAYGIVAGSESAAVFMIYIGE